MAKRLRIGFVGVGGIARYQIGLFQKIPGVEVVAAADVSADALAKVKEQFSIGHVTTDWRELVRMKNVDAVSVCTPNKLHAAPTIAALKAGKHVLVEKPMAMNAKEAAAMVAAGRKARRLLQIGFQWRFTPAGQLLMKQRAAGKFGKILYVRCQALRRRGIPNWGVFGQKSLQGGGPMIDIGVHILEVAHAVMGSPRPVTARGSCYTYLGNRKSEALCAWDNWDHKTYTVEDLAVGFLKFADGASLVIESSFAAHIEKDVFTFQIMGTKGGATMDPLKLFGDDSGYMLTSEPAFAGTWDAFDRKLRHFVDCVRDGKRCEAPGEDGLAVQQMLDAIYRSAELDREVVIR